MEKYQQLIHELKTSQNFLGEILENEDLAQKSTFKIGGKARLYIAPHDYYSFQLLIKYALNLNIKFFITGGASNLVFPDEIYEGLIISTHLYSDSIIFPSKDLPEDFGPQNFTEEQVLVSCFSGTPMASFVNFCTKHNLKGAQEFAGLPGTVGGACYMNARCFEKSISDLLFYISYLDYSSSNVKIKHSLFKPEEWDYKKSPFQGTNKLILTVTFLLTKAKNTENLEEECKKYIQERKSKGHFSYPSAGSVFKNNRDFGKPSGQIIDEAGLKGLQIGGAQIAPFHGNFIININKAKAKDVEDLVNKIKSTVSQKFGYNLETEIIFVK